MPNSQRKTKTATSKVVAAIKRMSIKPNTRRRPKTKKMNPKSVSRRSAQKIPSIQAPCLIKDVERLTTINIPTTTTAGQLLYNIAANPMVCPRLSATASQFDSWYGNMSMEVETTGNAFSKDFVVLRHLANGDPSRIPTVANNLLNLAETSERNGEQARLQLDCNRRARVTAIWSESYNPRKPIIDSDPTECNLGQFIIVSNGSPGTEAVSLVVRMRYRIHFFSPIYEPWTYDTSKIFMSGGTISTANMFGTAPTITGNGSQSIVANNQINFPKQGAYTINFNMLGSGISTFPTYTASPSVTSSVTFATVTTATASTASWDIVTSSTNTVLTFVGNGTITNSRLEISPN
jgi:hypothetical protein